MAKRVAITLLTMLCACSAASQVETASSGSSTGLTLGVSDTGGQPFTTASGTSGGGTGGSTTGAGSTGLPSTTGGLVCPADAGSCGGDCCPSGWGCVNEACCETPCAGTCCPGNSACVNGACATLCEDSAHCPSGTPCCSPQGAVSVCIAGDPTTQVCLCTNSTQCVTGCCAPAVDANDNPTGPYYCKPNDAAHYDCCFGTFNTCSGSDCCVTDGYGNEFCASPCTSSATCGSSVCQNYSFSSSLCEGPTACGPPS